MKIKITILTTLLALFCRGFAANVQIKDLTETTSLNGGDVFQLEQLIGGVYHDRKITFGNLQLSITIAGSQVTGAYSASNLTLSSGKLLGRASSGSGKAEELAADSTLTLSSGTFGVNNAAIAPAWANVTSKPTTLSGYGITDPVVLTSGTYANPAWLTALAWSKLSGTPTTLAGYGITDPVVLTSGTYANPAWLTGLAWSKISGTPTTLAGYGITDSVVLTGGSYSDPAFITALAWSKLTGVPSVLTALAANTGSIDISGLTIAFPANVITTTDLQSLTNKTYNGLVVTASASTLAMATGKTLQVNNSITLAGTDGKTLTLSKNLTFAGADGKTLSVNNSLTLSGTDGSSVAFGAGGTVVYTTGPQTLTSKTLTSPVINSPTGIVKGDVGLGNVDNTSDATKNGAAVTLTNHTIAASNVISPGATMLPNVLVVDGDSLSCAGQLYWPVNFTGSAGGLAFGSGGFSAVTSYNAVASYTGGSPAGNATGVKPLTSWPEQLIALSGAPTTLYNFAFAGRQAGDLQSRYFQEGHLLAPTVTGVPAAYALLIGTNDTAGLIAAATTNAELDQLATWARADGYYPVIGYTIPIATAWSVGGTEDTIRTTIATHQAAMLAAGTIDVLVDSNAVTGLTSTNVSGTWVHDVAGNWSTGFPNHLTSAGNALLAAQTFTQMKALSAPAKSALMSANQFSYYNLAPWARRRLRPADAQQNNSSGGTNLGGAVGGEMGILNGTGTASWSRVYWYVSFPGYGLGFNGGSVLGGKGKAVIDWGRPQRMEFTVHPDWGNTGRTFPHTTWQVVWGVANGRTPAALANSEYAFGLQFTCTVAGQLVIKAIAANGTTSSTSSTLATISDLSSDWQSITCQACTDGNGGLFVTINGVTTFLAGIAPTHIFRSDTAFNMECYTSSAEANNDYLEFTFPDISSQ